MTDPNQSAKADVDAFVGAPPSRPLPKHVTVASGTVTCATCGKTFALSKREGERAAELRAFGQIHTHVAI